MDEAEFRDLERHREDLLDASYGDASTDDPDAYEEARECLQDALSYLNPRHRESLDPESAIRSAREAITRIEAAL